MYQMGDLLSNNRPINGDDLMGGDPLTEWGDSPIPKSPLKEKRSGAHFST